jgi:hypothetical protein
MTVGQEVVERTNSPTFSWKSANKTSFGCIFRSFSVWYNFFQHFFSRNSLWISVDHSLRNTDLKPSGNYMSQLS